MKRLSRILPNGLTVISAVVFLAVVTLWVRGYRVADAVGVRRSDPAAHANTEYSIRNLRGGLAVVWSRNEIYEAWVYDYFARRSPWDGRYWSIGTPTPTFALGGGDRLREWRALGFGWLHYSIDRPDYNQRARALVVPCWALALLTGAAPARELVKATRRLLAKWRERAVGHCRKCGYDLRATPGRCPECGTAADLVRA